MDYVIIILKVIVGVSLLNVWLINFNKSTPFRGGSASNMKEEFSNYGLPEWVMYVVGGLKVIFAIVLIASIWMVQYEDYAALGIAGLMLGAVSMHIKIKDSLKKTYPAALFLVFSLIIYFL